MTSLSPEIKKAIDDMAMEIEGSQDQCCIDFEKAWRVLAFSNKANAKKVLPDEGIPLKWKEWTVPSNGGHRLHKMMLTLQTFDTVMSLRKRAINKDVLACAIQRLNLKKTRECVEKATEERAPPTAHPREPNTPMTPHDDQIQRHLENSHENYYEGQLSIRLKSLLQKMKVYCDDKLKEMKDLHEEKLRQRESFLKNDNQETLKEMKVHYENKLKW
eukprot:CAMPEP_0184501936 /NCGR_PEP_ID=MMETSP0113_2-20130426/48963_1 /TAXON_ID=91329 /ORGANISM="Norrisiella sphaerica, Strain BC52" /LENGTH=215 /DNA_ID=CAMNT_0026890883 /DNA_START=30 /DNA_END=674 /DNA_ORIENTATION=-